MSKDLLLTTAQALTQPSVTTAREYESKRELLAAEISRILELRPDLFTLIGEGNTGMMEDNHRNHARFMSSVFHDYQPVVLVETVLWVFRAYRSHGFHLTYWPAQLDLWVELYKTSLSEDAFREIYPFYNWMILNQPLFVMLSDKFVMAGDKPDHDGK